jgi:hypothetical protein
VAIPVTRRQVLDLRLRAQQLDRDSGIVVDTAVLGVLVDGEQAERLAAFRELQLSGVEVTD